jgi:hypothetical protein
VKSFRKESSKTSGLRSHRSLRASRREGTRSPRKSESDPIQSEARAAGVDRCSDSLLLPGHGSQTIEGCKLKVLLARREGGQLEETANGVYTVNCATIR